tara:strand:- start:10033 stop:11211 length:1179 start_codon:yes stop_codon:yes gene_type:complete
MNKFKYYNLFLELEHIIITYNDNNKENEKEIDINKEIEKKEGGCYSLKKEEISLILSLLLNSIINYENEDFNKYKIFNDGIIITDNIFNIFLNELIKINILSKINLLIIFENIGNSKKIIIKKNDKDNSYLTDNEIDNLYKELIKSFNEKVNYSNFKDNQKLLLNNYLEFIANNDDKVKNFVDSLNLNIVDSNKYTWYIQKNDYIINYGIPNLQLIDVDNKIKNEWNYSLGNFLYKGVQSLNSDLIKYHYNFRKSLVPAHEVWHILQDNKLFNSNLKYYSFIEYNSKYYIEYEPSLYNLVLWYEYHKNKLDKIYILEHIIYIKYIILETSKLLLKNDKIILDKWIKNENLKQNEEYVLDNTIMYAENKLGNTYAKFKLALNGFKEILIKEWG